MLKHLSGLNKTALGDGDVAPGGILHQVHHLVGGTDDFLDGAAVLRVTGNAEAGHHAHLESFGQQIFGIAQGMQEALGDLKSRIFSGLGKQNDELVSSVAEGGIDSPHTVLDGPGNLGQQAAAGQVPVEVVDALEVVQVDEDQAEGETEAAGALNLDLGDGKKMPRVEEAGAVIGDGQFLNDLHGTHIL